MAIGLAHEVGDVMIVAANEAGDEMHLAFTGDDAPAVAVQLLAATARLATASTDHVLRRAIVLDDLSVVQKATSGNHILLASPAWGGPFTLSLSPQIAAALCDQLNDALDE